MATKKAAAKKTTAPAKKTAPKTTNKAALAQAAESATASKMTKTQVVRHMAERLEVAPRQVTAFFDL